MRRWINLFEYFGETLVQDEITDVHMIIGEYVGAGEGASTRKFREVYDLLPRPEQGMTLHRVLRLTPDQMTQYRRDQTFELRPMEYASWTKCDDAARLLAQTKGEHVIVVTQHFPAWEIVIDIEEFYSEHDLTHTDEYLKYVQAEQEVIVRHIAPIAVSDKNSRAFEGGDVLVPQVGDQGFLFDSEDDYAIESIAEEQPMAARGLFKVSFGRGEWIVRHIGEVNGKNQWEEVEHLIHE